MRPPARLAWSALALIAATGLAACSDTSGPPALAVTVLPGLLSLDIGDTLRLNATVHDRSGTNVAGATFTFSVNDPVVASVSTTGLVTALAGGTATVTATSGTVSASASITVAGVAASVEVTPPSVDVPLGGNRQVSVTVRDAQSRPLNHPSLAYVSLDTSVATVTAGGLITARAVGFDSLTITSGGAGKTVPVAVVTHPAGTAAGSPAVANKPFAIAISRNGVAYAGRQDVPFVQLTVLPDSSFPDSIRVGSDPTDIAFNASGTTAYVTNQLSANLGIISVGTKQSIDSIAIPNGNPSRVVLAPDDQHVYVSTSGGRIVEIATATKAITRQFLLGTSAVNGMTFEPTGGILYATMITGTIFEISVTGGAIRLVTPGGTFQDIAVSLDGVELYTANESGELDVRDAATGTRITTIPAAANAFGLKLSPDGTQLYATFPAIGLVKIIDRVTRTVVTTLTVGGTPRRIAFDHLGREALIPNESGFVSIIK
jgi:YVTN family beta-propeller protein